MSSHLLAHAIAYENVNHLNVNVVAGGRTIFDGAQLSVGTRPGSALVWWNLRSDGSLDTRRVSLIVKKRLKQKRGEGLLH